MIPVTFTLIRALIWSVSAEWPFLQPGIMNVMHNRAN